MKKFIQILNENENVALPISRERAKEIIANGHDGHGNMFNSDKKQSYRDLMTSDENVAMMNYFQQHAKGYESFNSILRKCAK